MANVKMKEVPVIAVKGRSVVVPRFVGPAIKGSGDINYLCSSCDEVLLENVTHKQVGANIVVKCAKCGKYNEIPRSHETD